MYLNITEKEKIMIAASLSRQYDYFLYNKMQEEADNVFELHKKVLGLDKDKKSERQKPGS